MLAPPRDQFIGRCLEVYGEFSPGEWEMLAQIIKPGLNVVEVGSNIGVHTVPMARACRPGHLYAYEPQRRIFQILCANLVLNDIDNVVAAPDACGDQRGEARIPAYDYQAAGNFGGVSIAPAHTAGELVRVVPLDDLRLLTCGLIKVDVEGHESQVLIGAAETIARCRPVLYVENDREPQQRGLIKLIHGMGYRLYWHTPRLVGRNNFNGVEGNVFPIVYGSINMLCLPSERDVPTDLEQIDPLDPRLPRSLSPERKPVGG